MDRYDVVVLGGGTGGYCAALRAAQRGAKVCVIEANRLGGTCLNTGCIPTKALLHASELAFQAGRGAEMGLVVENLRVDGEALMARITGVVSKLRQGVASLLKARKVDVIAGRGRLRGEDTLAIDSPDGRRDVQAGAIIIATGSRPARPAFAPWDSPRVWTTDEATVATDLPASVLIVGGGIIGSEFATAYAELGVETTLIELLPRLVSELGRGASGVVAAGLKARGVNVLTGAEIVAMGANDSAVSAELADGTTLRADRALVAVGRVANVEEIGLDTAGVELADGVIRVDDRCRTNVPGIYAIGDVAEKLQLAHLATRMGLVAADNATGHEAADDRAVVPAVVYTHPQVATVGMGAEAARQRGDAVRVARFPYMASGMAHACGATEGKVELIAESDGGVVLGGSVAGFGASDVIQEIALAVRHRLTVEQIAETIHPHPTFTEAVAEAAESWLGLPLHVLR